MYLPKNSTSPLRVIKTPVEVAAGDVVDHGAVHLVVFDGVTAPEFFLTVTELENWFLGHHVSTFGAFRKCDVTSGSADVSGVDRLTPQSGFFLCASFTFSQKRL